MKRIFLTLIAVSTMMYGITSADLKVYALSEDEPAGYYDSQETLFQSNIASADSAAMNRGYLGMAFLEMARGKYNGDDFIDSLSAWSDTAGQDMEQFLTSVDDNLIPIFTNNVNGPEDILHNLSTFFSRGNYSTFKSDFQEAQDKFDTHFGNLDSILSNFNDDASANMQNAIDDFEWVWDNDADFTFILEVVEAGGYESGDQYIFTRRGINRVKNFGQKMDEFSDAMDRGLNMLDSLSHEASGDTGPAVDELKIAVHRLQDASDTLTAILTSDPFVPFSIDTRGIADFHDAMDSVLTVLDGREFEIDGQPGYTFKPLAVIENSPWGLEHLYTEFYTSSDQNAYTFGGIFPNGLPPLWVQRLSQDMVFNTVASQVERDAYLALKETQYVTVLGTSSDTQDLFEAWVGRAMIIYSHQVDRLGEISGEVMTYLDNGNIDSLLFHYDWSQLNDVEAEFDRADEMLQNAENLGNGVFTLVMKDGENSSAGAALEPGDVFNVLYMTRETLQGMILAYDGYKQTKEGISQAATAIQDELGSMFDTYLDPNLIDFSNVESDLDLINALEAANPDFLKLTDYGKQNFRDMGQGLADFTRYLAEVSDSMKVAGEAFRPFAEDFNIDGDAMLDQITQMDSLGNEISADFNVPGKMNIIDGERVDLSAWFDTPPDNLLQVWKRFVTGQDSSLWGLFPDRLRPQGIESPVLPDKWAISEAWPNPFNPVTRIHIDLPQNSAVRITVLNIRGQMVDILKNGVLNRGSYEFIWNANAFSSGIYFIRVQTADGISIRKVSLLK